MLLGSKVRSPPLGKLCPPALGLLRGWLTNTHCPAEVVSIVEAEGERALNCGGREPTGEDGVGGNTAFQAAGEAVEGAGGVIVGCLGRKGALVIDFPKEEEGHAGFACCNLRREQIRVVSNPNRQTGIRFRHL